MSRDEAMVSSAAGRLRPLKILGGHDGWIWDVAVDPENEWFATASADNTIKIWALAQSKLKLTLTNHRLPVRSLAISDQMPYMFSGSEDQEVLCWDLEHNKPVRQYHGHRSGVYTVALHPEIPYLLASGSRDSSVRVWDVRSRAVIHVLNHDGPVNRVVMQSDEPQLISASQDRTVKTWDIVSGQCTQTLTHHENSVRALACHPLEYTFVSAGRDALRQWKLPESVLIGEFGAKGENVTSVVCDEANLYAGYETAIRVYKYADGEMIHEAPVPSPALATAIDRSGTRLISGHMDKTIRLWSIT